MSNIKVPITDIASVVDKQKNVIKAADRELDKFNKKAKDAPLSKTDLDRIKRVEAIRDQAKQNVEFDAQQRANLTRVQQTTSIVQTFVGNSALQKLTSGQRLDVSDAIGFARLIEKPVYSLIEKYTQHAPKAEAPANKEPEKPRAPLPPLENSKADIKVWLAKEQKLLESLLAFKSSAATGLSELRGVLNPDGTKSFLPTSTVGIGALGTAFGFAAYGVNRLLSKVDKQEENAQDVYRILRDSPRGSVSENERSALLGNADDVREFYRDPVAAFHENRAAQAKADSALGTGGANNAFRQALKIVRKEGLFDQAIAAKRRELGRELTDADYAAVRASVLASKEFTHSLSYYDGSNLLAAQDRLNQRLLDGGRIGNWEKFKRDSGTAFDRARFAEGRELINQYTNLVAEADGNEIPADLRPQVMTARDVLKEQQISDREAWFSAHRRSRHYFKFNREELQFNRMN